MKGRRLLLWIFAAIVLVVANAQILAKEAVIAQGEVVFLRLAPVDPRSLLQGDYMRLRYAHSIPDSALQSVSGSGYLIVQIDPRSVGRIVAVHGPGVDVGPDMRLMRFRHAGYREIDIGAQSFFFEEGTGRRFAAAAYAELRLASDGTVVLVGLRDEALNLLGEALR